MPALHKNHELTILSAVAEAERDRIRERISDVKRDQRTRNRYLGGSVPFGMRLVMDADKKGGGSLVDVPEEQEAIRAMLALHSAGKSLRAIAEAMKAQGHNISHNAVKQILDRSEGRPGRSSRYPGLAPCPNAANPRSSIIVIVALSASRGAPPPAPSAAIIIIIIIISPRRGDHGNGDCQSPE